MKLWRNSNFYIPTLREPQSSGSHHPSASISVLEGNSVDAWQLHSARRLAGEWKQAVQSFPEYVRLSVLVNIRPTTYPLAKTIPALTPWTACTHSTVASTLQSRSFARYMLAGLPPFLSSKGLNGVSGTFGISSSMRYANMAAHFALDLQCHCREDHS